MKLYTIGQIDKKNKEIIYPSISVTANGPDADFCNDTTVRFVFWSKEPGFPWVSTSYEHVKNLVEGEKVGWYNSSIETPVLDKQPAYDYVVVDLDYEQ